MSRSLDRIKLQHVDSVAYSKGYRRGQVLRVLDIDGSTWSKRGPLYYVQRRGCNPEGFYADQVRAKPSSTRG